VERRYPALRIRLDILNLKAPMERLQDNIADLALSEFLPEGDEFEFRECGKVLMQPMASPGLIRPLPKKLNSDQMKDYRQIVVSDHPTTRAGTTVAVLPSAPKWNVTDFHVKKEFLLAGMGWGNMPLHIVKSELKKRRLVLLPYGEALCVQLYLIRRRKDFWGPASQYIWSALEWNEKSI
jgi:DNA-binding transcriptional LysR family regulator